MEDKGLTKKLGDFYGCLSNGFYALSTNDEKDIDYAGTFYNDAKEMCDDITKKIFHESLNGSLDRLAIMLKNRGVEL